MTATFDPRLPALAVMATTILAAAILACGPAAAETIDQLYAAAKAEKEVVLWGAGPTAGYEAAARGFEQQFPGVKVSLMGGFSNVLNAKVEEQFGANKVDTDVLIFQTVQDFVGWNKRGLLMHFKPDGFDTIGASYKDKDGAWIAVNANPLFYGINSEHLAPDRYPRSAARFPQTRAQGQAGQRLSGRR